MSKERNLIKDDPQKVTILGAATCCHHPKRTVVLECLMNRGFCSECVATVELRTAGCGYCSLKAKCPVQKHYHGITMKGAIDPMG